MLDINAIYNKTEAGLSEVQTRKLGLRAELRRLLILVDGKTPVSRLAMFVRGAEIESLIFELETQGLITSPTTNGYRKTEAGVAEVQKRLLGLRPALRRLLILVDGKTPLSRLSGLVPGMDVSALVAELEALGLIVAANELGAAALPNSRGTTPIRPEGDGAPVTTDTAATSPVMSAGAVSRPPVTPSHLSAVRSAAVRELQRLLGVTKHQLLDKLHQPEDSLALRAVISEVHQSLDEQFGVDTGQQFLDAVRGAASAGSGETT